MTGLRWEVEAAVAAAKARREALARGDDPEDDPTVAALAEQVRRDESVRGYLSRRIDGTARYPFGHGYDPLTGCRSGP